MITDLPSNGNKWFEVLFFVFVFLFTFFVLKCAITPCKVLMIPLIFERSVCITAVAEEVLCAMHVQKPGEERSVQQQHPPR